MRIKRSEMEAKLLEPWARGPGALEYAQRALMAMEEAGMEWEPEEPEWPELVRGGMASLEYGKYQGCLLVVGADGSRRPVEREVGDRIARAWKARRPGGEMERRLREVARELDPGASGADRRMLQLLEGALRLGVE